MSLYSLDQRPGCGTNAAVDIVHAVVCSTMYARAGMHVLVPLYV